MWVLFFIASALSECVIERYFTACTSLQKRDLILTSASSDCSNSYPLIYKDLDCNYPCAAGSYFDVVEGTEGCSLCPSGSFSIGGGFIYGHEGLPWTSALDNFKNDCWVKEKFVDYKNVNCTAWGLQDQIIASGTTSSISTYASSLTFGAVLVTPGILTITYRKDTFQVHDQKIGTFSIFNNEIKIHNDHEVEQSTWKTISLPLEKGSQQFYIEYRTVKSNNSASAHAYISSLQITGISYADLDCFPCETGANLPGSTSCEVCDFNQYWDGGVCLECPDNTFSLKGSTGIGSCYLRLACKESDYKHVYSACVNDAREQSFQWKEPIFCDYLNYKLPDTVTGLPCEICKPGYFIEESSNVTSCTACPNGQFLSSSQCTNCTAGNYSWKTFNITDWTEIPEGFSTYCITNTGGMCIYSNGWVPSTYFLSSGIYLQAHSELFLNRYFFIEANTGILIFTYEFINKGSGTLDIYVNGVWVSAFSEVGNNIGRVNLKQGSNQVQWAYWPAETSNEEVRIYDIKIHGSDEGSAVLCLKCPIGFISTQGQSSCTMCPDGYTSSGDSISCIQCSDYYFNAPDGRCLKCPPGTIHNHNHTACIGTDYAYFNKQTFFLSNITGRGPKEGEYYGGICQMPTSKFYCHQTFYGPLSSTDKEFYISVLNPSDLILPNTDYLYNSKSGYAFAVVKKSSISKVKEDSKTGCSSQDLIINLGSSVSGLNLIDKGFRIDYSWGDLCDKVGNVYNMSLTITCDKSAGVGWPSWDSDNGCNYNFVWLSKYGCPICMFSDMTTVSGECVDGFRKFTKVEGENCIIPFEDDLFWTEPCSELDDYMSTWPMILGFTLLIILIVLSLISGACFLKYQRGYKRLTEVNDPN